MEGRRQHGRFFHDDRISNDRTCLLQNLMGLNSEAALFHRHHHRFNLRPFAETARGRGE